MPKFAVNKNNTDSHLYKTDGISIEVVDNNAVDIDHIVLMNNALYFKGSGRMK